MQRKLSFRLRLRTIWWWLFQYNKGTMMSCLYCGSSEVVLNKETEHIEDNKYYSSCTCTKCGATCDNKEVWYKKINP